MMKTKVCTVCGEEKLIRDFHKNGKYYRSACRECHNRPRRVSTNGTDEIGTTGTEVEMPPENTPPPLEEEEIGTDMPPIKVFGTDGGGGQWTFSSSSTSTLQECDKCGRDRYLYEARNGNQDLMVCNTCTLVLVFPKDLSDDEEREKGDV